MMFGPLKKQNLVHHPNTVEKATIDLTLGRLKKRKNDFASHSLALSSLSLSPPPSMSTSGTPLYRHFQEFVPRHSTPFFVVVVHMAFSRT